MGGVLILRPTSSWRNNQTENYQPIGKFKSWSNQMPSTRYSSPIRPNSSIIDKRVRFIYGGSYLYILLI